MGAKYLKRALLIGQRTTQATTASRSQDFREYRFPVVLNFHRECWNPVKKHLKALVFFAVSKQIPIVYSAGRGRAEITCYSDGQSIKEPSLNTLLNYSCILLTVMFTVQTIRTGVCNDM